MNEYTFDFNGLFNEVIEAVDRMDFPLTLDSIIAAIDNI